MTIQAKLLHQGLIIKGHLFQCFRLDRLGEKITYSARDPVGADNFCHFNADMQARLFAEALLLA